MEFIFTSGSSLVDSLGTTLLEDLWLAPTTTLLEEKGVVSALAPTGEWEASLLLARWLGGQLFSRPVSLAQAS